MQFKRTIESLVTSTTAKNGRMSRSASSVAKISQAISVIAPSATCIKSPFIVYEPEIEL